MRILVAITLVFGFQMSRIASSDTEPGVKDMSAAIRGEDFKKFKADIEKCLKASSSSCLLEQTLEVGQRSFASLQPQLGMPDEEIECGPVGETGFSAKQVYECLFREGGKNLKREMLAAFGTKKARALSGFRYDDGVRVEFIKLIGPRDLVEVHVRKVDGRWRIIGISA